MDIKKVFLKTLLEDKYARVDYLKARQGESDYTETVFIDKLLDAYEFFESEIKHSQRHLRSKMISGVSETGISKVSLPINSYCGDLYGHFGYPELAAVLNSIAELRDEFTKANNDIPDYIKQAIHQVALEVSKNSPNNDYKTISKALQLYYSTDLNGKDVAKKTDIKPNTFSTWKTKVDDKL